MGMRVVTVNDVLDGHVALDIECLDRVYLNGYVPILQSSGQVVAFLCQHLGYPFPSPALFDKIGQRFRAAVMIQAPGLDGVPSRGQRSSAIVKASCTASSASWRSPRTRVSVATARPHSSLKTRPTSVVNAR